MTQSLSTLQVPEVLVYYDTITFHPTSASGTCVSWHNYFQPFKSHWYLCIMTQSLSTLQMPVVLVYKWHNHFPPFKCQWYLCIMTQSLSTLQVPVVPVFCDTISFHPSSAGDTCVLWHNHFSSGPPLAVLATHNAIQPADENVCFKYLKCEK